jgi:predicted nucleotidyltransferase
MKPGDHDLRRVEEVARTAAALAREILGGDVSIVWFGSWPEKRACARSDIDLALVSPSPVPSEKMARFRDAVDEIPTLYTIDIVDLAEVEPEFRKRVEERGVRI